MGNRDAAWKREIRELDEDALLERWRSMIAEIADQIVAIRRRHRIFAELDNELVRRHKGQPTNVAVARFLRPLYGDAQLVALRRVTLDRDPRAVSLTALLNQIKERPEALSRQSYRDAAAALPVALDLTDRDLDYTFGTDNDHFPSEVLDTWVADVAADYDRIKEYANTHVAHRDRDRANVKPITWGAIDDALDALGQHLNRLHLPLTGASHSPDLISRTDWRVAFSGLFDDP